MPREHSDFRPLSEEFPISAGDYLAITEQFLSNTGINLGFSKRPMLLARLSKRLRVLGLSGFGEYRRLLESPNGQSELEQMISLLTTNVTRFFREGRHFEDLAANVLPDLIDRARNGDRIRLWSAGCSSGEEPFSLAFTLLTQCPDALDLDIKVLATDIDSQVLSKGQNAVYQKSNLLNLPHGVLEKFFDPVPENPDSFEVCLAARQLVSFKKLNLVEDWPFSGFFDVVLCRNVVIYFENTTQEKLWVQFAKHMKPNSNLYLGHSERLSPSALKNFRSVGDTRYVRAHNLLNSGRELLGASRENGVAYEP